jgi:hypothetical protein
MAKGMNARSNQKKAPKMSKDEKRKAKREKRG